MSGLSAQRTGGGGLGEPGGSPSYPRSRLPAQRTGGGGLGEPGGSPSYPRGGPPSRSRCAVLTISDGVHEGTRDDASGDLLAALLGGDGFEVARRVVPDDKDAIAEAIAELCDEAALVLTTGGTGVGPRDVTPEATGEVLERLAPGIAEAIRADAVSKTPHGLLSRGLAGVRGQTLVVNLPGSTGGCRDGFAVLRPALRHALELLAGEKTSHRQT